MNRILVSMVLIFLGSGIFVSVGCIDSSEEPTEITVEFKITFNGKWSGSVGSETSSMSVSGYRLKKY